MLDELRAIPGWEGLYSVTADGRVWSHARAVVAGKRRWSQAGQWIKPAIHPRHGYLFLNLHRDGVSTTFMVHRLVALAWLPSPTGGREHINHKDSNRQNNHHTNLEWCTPSENNLHGWRQGGRVVTEGQMQSFEKAHAARRSFSEAQVASIRSRVTAGEKQRALAREFGVSPAAICSIVSGRNYPTNGERNAI